MTEANIQDKKSSAPTTNTTRSSIIWDDKTASDTQFDIASATFHYSAGQITIITEKSFDCATRDVIDATEEHIVRVSATTIHEYILAPFTRQMNYSCAV